MTEQQLLMLVNKFVPAGGVFVALVNVPESLVRQAMLWYELELLALRLEREHYDALRAKAEWEALRVRYPVATKKAIEWRKQSS